MVLQFSRQIRQVLFHTVEMEFISSHQQSLCDDTPDNTSMPINAVCLLVIDMPVNDLVCLIMLMNTVNIYVLGTNNLILQFFTNT